MTACITLFSQELLAQNYRLINPEKTVTYAKRNMVEEDSIYFFMKVDSIGFEGTDSVFYFNHFIDTLNEGVCEIENGDTVMLGNKMILQSDTDATHVFFNKFGDSIFIKSLVDIGDVWHIYEWSNGTYVKATVVNKLWLTILPEVQDSVTRIQLNVFTSGGMMLSDTFPNQTKWDITKNHGLIEFFDFHNFPQTDDSLPLLLRGIANPDLNVVDIDAETAFSYELGFEFHYREEIKPDAESGAEKRISAWKYFVQNKVTGINSVTYTMERLRFDTLYFGDIPTSSLVWDTIEVSYNYADYAYLDTLELNLFQANNFGFSDWVKNDTIYAGIPHKFVYDWYEYNDATNCLMNPDGINQPEQIYGNGLGLMHYKDSIDADNYYSFDMVYFQTGLLQWGIPYDFSDLDLAVENINSKDQILIYPNPTKNELIIHSDHYLGTTSISIFNLHGQLVKYLPEVLADNDLQVNVEDLNPGCYVILLSNRNASRSAIFVKE